MQRREGAVRRRSVAGLLAERKREPSRSANRWFETRFMGCNRFVTTVAGAHFPLPAQPKLAHLGHRGRPDFLSRYLFF
jgi:hypothetical protein